MVCFLDFKRFLFAPPLGGWAPLPSRIAFFLVSSNLPPFTCSDAYDALEHKDWVLLRTNERKKRAKKGIENLKRIHTATCQRLGEDCPCLHLCSGFADRPLFLLRRAFLFYYSFFVFILTFTNSFQKGYVSKWLRSCEAMRLQIAVILATICLLLFSRREVNLCKPLN